MAVYLQHGQERGVRIDPSGWNGSN